LLGQNKIDEKKLDKLFWEGKYPEILQDYYILYKQDLNNPEICFKYGTSLLFEADSIQKLIKANNLLLFSASQETATAEYHFYCGRAYHARSVFDSALVQFELYKSKKVKKTIELPADLFITYCNNGKSLPRISSGKLDRYSDIPPEDIGESYDLRKIKMNGRFDPYKTNLTKVDIKKGIKPVWLYSDYTLKFFASYGEKDEGNKDIYMVEGSRDQKKITRLPNIINTNEEEDYPYFDFETNYLYFSSKGHNSIGGYDIFRIDYDTSTHSFGKVENLGLGISTPFDDYLFIYNSKVNQALLTSSWLGKTNRLALFSGNLSIYDKNKEKKQNIVVNFKNESDPTIKLTEIKVLDKNTQELIGKFTVDEKGNAGINLLPGEYSYIFNIYGSKDDFKANISIPSSDTPILQEITFKLDDKNNEKVIITDQNSGKNNEIIAENLDKDSQKNELISNPKDNQTDIINPINPNLEKEALERLGIVGLNQNEIVDKVSDKLIEFELAQKENELLMSNLNAVIAANRTYYEELQQEIDSIEGSIVEISEMEKMEKLSYIKNLIAEQNEVMNQTLWMQTLNDSLQSVYSEKQKLNNLVKFGDRIQDLTEQNNYADAYRNIIEEYKQIETLSSNSAFENIYNELYENELEQARIEKNIISLTSEIVTLNENLQNTELDLLNASKKDKTRLEEQRANLQQKINSNKKQTKAYQRDLEETKNQGVDLVLKRNLISTVSKEVVDETLSYENAKEKYFTETNKSQLHLNSIQQRIKESNEKLSDTEKKYLNFSEEYMTKKSNLDENGSTEQLIELEEKLAESIKDLLSELNENQQNITSNGVVQENYLQEKLQESQARINELRENQTDIVSTNGSEINNEKVANPDVNSSNNIAKNQPTNSQGTQQNQNSTSSSNTNEKEGNPDVNSSKNVANNQTNNSQNSQQNQNSTASSNTNEKEANSDVNSSNNIANNQTTNSQNSQQNQNSTSSSNNNEKQGNPDVISSNNIAKNQPTNSQNSQQNQNTTSSSNNNEKEANPDVNSSNNIAKNQPTNSQNSQQNQNSTSSSNNNEKEANPDVNSSNNIAKNQPTNSQGTQQNQNTTSSTNNNEKEGNPDVNSSKNVANNQTNNSQNSQQNQNSTASSNTNEKEANSDVNSSNNIANNQTTNSQNSQQNQNSTSSSNNNEKQGNPDVNSSNNVANNQTTNSQNSQQNQNSTSSTNANEKQGNPEVNSTNNVANNQTTNSQNSQQNQNSTSSSNNNEKEDNPDVNSSNNIAKNQTTNSQNSQQNQNSSSSTNTNGKEENPNINSSNNVADKQAEYIPQLQKDVSEITNEELTNLSSEFKNDKNSLVSELKKSNPSLQLQSTNQLEFERSRLDNNLSKIETEINDLEVLLKNQKKKKDIEKIELLIRDKEQELKSITEQKDEIAKQIDVQKKDEITLNLNDHSVSLDDQKSKEILSSNTYKEYVIALVAFQKEKESHTSISTTLINQQNKLNELVNIQVLSKDKRKGSVEIEMLIKEIEKSQKQQEASYNLLKERKKSVEKIELENQNISAELQTLAANRKEPLTKIEVVNDEIISSGGFELNTVSNTKTSDNAIIPINVKAPSGLIYRVQIGAFRKPLQNNVYSQFTPVSGELQQNGLTVYMAGYFNNSINAVNAKKQIQSLGYSDAFIVAYCNGKKLTLGEARQLESRGECIPQGDNTFLVEISKNTKQAILEQKTQSNIANSTISTVDTKSLFFTVQIGVYNKPIDEKQKFPGLTEINTTVSPKNQIRYATGMFSDLNSAKIRKNSAVQSGISDAFIVAYYQGERITIAKANELLAKNDELVYKQSKQTNLNISIDSVQYVENEKPLFELDKKVNKVERIKYKVNSNFEELPKEKLAYFNQYGLFQFDNETGTLLSTEFSREIDLKDELKLSGLVSEVKNNDKLDNTKSVQMDELKGDLMDVILRTNWLNSIETSKEISLILNSRISTMENYTNLLKNTFDLKIENYDKK
jgi:hypothetical protein